MRFFDSSRIDGSEKSKAYVRTRYRELAKQYHPDKNNGNSTLMDQVNLEYEIAKQGLDIQQIIRDPQLHRPYFDFFVLVGTYALLALCVNEAPPKTITMLRQVIQQRYTKITMTHKKDQHAHAA